MIVLYASAVVEVTLGTNTGRQIARDLLERDEKLCAPEVLALEVAHAIRRQLNLKRIDPRQADRAIEIYSSMPIELRNHKPLLSRVWQLRSNLTPYDASYVALAEQQRCVLWTCDAKYVGAQGIRAEITYISRAP
jgi:predicted nucleic acid-binding protein